MAADVALPDAPKPVLPIHQNHNDVATAFEAALGDGPLNLSIILNAQDQANLLAFVIGQ